MDTSSPSATSPDALLSVTSSDVDPRVAAFLAEVRAEYRAPVPNDVAAGHLRMILAEAAVAPTAPALRDRWARHARRIAAVGAVKIALTATAAAAATGTGLAATNNLPAPAQAVVADAAGLVGITFPTPDTPGDRADGRPGIGEGGVPVLQDQGGELPGRSGEAPGITGDTDARPVTPDRVPAEAEQGNAGGDVRGEDRAEERPAPPATEGSARTQDSPAAERPDAPATRPAPPRSDGAAEAEAGGTDASAPADTAPPVERPEKAGDGRGASDG